MSLLDKWLEQRDASKLEKLLDRQCNALERIADCLEALLPSPFTSQQMKNNDFKPKGVESLKIYGTKEAYYDELARQKEEIDA